MRRIAVVALCLLPTLAFAQPVQNPAPQAIDLTAPLHDENGQPWTDCVKAAPDGKACFKTEAVTVGRALAHALFLMTEADRNLSPDDRWKRGALGMEIEHATSIRLDVDQAKMVRDCVGRAYPPLLVAQLFPLIDPNAKPDQKAAKP